MKGTAMAAALTAVLLGASACTSASQDRPEGGSRTTPAAASAASLDALRAAEKATERAGSAKMRSLTVMGTQMSLKADGALDWKGDLTGAMTITYTGGTVARTMRQMGVTTMRARYLADAYYAHMGDTFAARIGGRHWLRYAYEDLKNVGAGADLADQMRRTTPDESVKLLLDSKDVHETGTETVDGRTATHYSGTVLVADVSDGELREQLRQAGVTSETVDVWIDEEDLLVKKVEKSRTASGNLTQTARYSDYGVRVSVRKPPASDTEDFKKLLGTQNGS
ncbi:hypothetical protein ACIPSE_04190 [Streptomyces sp. NPDC090106]|uniref:hypothetical protein n=1 Tax=Streptomyces sp. NPDC090106 TaxID=3365946 RepID=UPI00382C2B5E